MVEGGGLPCNEPSRNCVSSRGTSQASHFRAAWSIKWSAKGVPEQCLDEGFGDAHGAGMVPSQSSTVPPSCAQQSTSHSVDVTVDSADHRAVPQATRRPEGEEWRNELHPPQLLDTGGQGSRGEAAALLALTTSWPCVLRWISVGTPIAMLRPRAARSSHSPGTPPTASCLHIHAAGSRCTPCKCEC